MPSHEDVEIVEIAQDKSAVCREVLSSLPAWFGIPEALEAYVREVAALPMLGAMAGGSVVGFISLRQHSPFAAEAFVLGVKPEWRRKGVGRRLFAAAEALLRARRLRFFTVKTVAAPDGDLIYGATLKFYEAIGFMPVETFPTLWHERNPCLFLVKPLD
jgi:ribosomal protein S18 acetylase RimI-like enzyme